VANPVPNILLKARVVGDEDIIPIDSCFKASRDRRVLTVQGGVLVIHTRILASSVFRVGQEVHHAASTIEYGG
jgi:hypothetical protein